MRDKYLLKRLFAGALSISVMAVSGCTEPEDIREDLLKKDNVLQNIASGQLPSLLVIAYKKKYSLECPVGEPMNGQREFFEWADPNASIGKTHTDYMVCLDLAQDRQGALLEAHRILNLEPYLSEDYGRSSIIYAASYLAEATTGSVADQAIGSTRLVELQEAPFPNNKLDAEGKRLTNETKSKRYFKIIQEMRE